MMTYIYYLIYIAVSFSVEFIFCIYIQSKVDDKDTFRINKFHLGKLFSDNFQEQISLLMYYSWSKCIDAAI